MHVQIVTYSLQGITEEEYIDVAYQVAPRFAAMPGLEAKLWLEDAASNRYGAVYFWQDREAMERFVRSDLFEATNADFADVRAEDFDILSRVTIETQPGFEIVPSPVPAGARPEIGAAAAATTGGDGDETPPAVSGRRRGAARGGRATKATATGSRAQGRAREDGGTEPAKRTRKASGAAGKPAAGGTAKATATGKATSKRAAKTK